MSSRMILLAMGLWLAGRGPTVAATGPALEPGQEFVYGGKGEMSFPTGNEKVALPFTLRQTLLITEKWPAGGYTLASVQTFQPELAMTVMMPQAQEDTFLQMVRLSPDGRVVPGGTDPIPSTLFFGAVSPWLFPALPEGGLQAGAAWTVRDSLMATFPLDFQYTVTGAEEVQGKPCWKVEKKPGVALPYQPNFGGGPGGPAGQSMVLTLHQAVERFWLTQAEPGTLIQYEKQHETEQSMVGQSYRQGHQVRLLLEETKVLPEAELAGRKAQLPLLLEAQKYLAQAQMSFWQGATVLDPGLLLAAAQENLTRFHQLYPDTPYQAVAAALDRGCQQCEMMLQQKAGGPP